MSDVEQPDLRVVFCERTNHDCAQDHLSGASANGKNLGVVGKSKRLKGKHDSKRKPSGPRPVPTPARWAVMLDEYLDHLAAAGYPATTRATRRAHLIRIARVLGVSPENVSGASLVRFFAQQEHWARETRRGYRNSCVSFFGWLHKTGRIQTDPSADLPTVAPAPANPRPAPDRVYRASIMAAGPREMLMLRLAAELGLRRAEVAVVSTSDLTEGLDGYQLVVHGKGGKLRTLPVSDELGDLIAAGAAGHTEDAPDVGYLFPGDDDGHLSPRWVGKLCAAAMPDGWTMHKLRHRFATRAYRGTRNLRAVQTMLGHASVATTELYTAVDDGEVRAAMLAAGDRMTTRSRIAGIATAVAAALVVIAGAMSPSTADALVDMFTPDERIFLSAVEIAPDVLDRTEYDVVSLAREACRIHDEREDGNGAGEAAAIAFLTDYPWPDAGPAWWNAAAPTLCGKRAA